jgi:uncharacterized protein (DUF58 family)
LKLPAGRLQETAYRNTMPRRGRYRLSGFRLATKFPFGFIPRARAVADVDDLYVYPALIPAPEALLRGLPAHPAPGRSFRASRQGEFRGLRAYRDGDDPRDIHWRSSARRGVTLVREKEDEETREATVVLDNDPAAAADAAAFERAVSETAGVCVELARRGLQRRTGGARRRAARGGGQRSDGAHPAHAGGDRPRRRPAAPRPARTIVRIRPGAPPTLQAAPGAREIAMLA